MLWVLLKHLSLRNASSLPLLAITGQGQTVSNAVPISEWNLEQKWPKIWLSELCTVAGAEPIIAVYSPCCSTCISGETTEKLEKNLKIIHCRVTVLKQHGRKQEPRHAILWLYSMFMLNARVNSYQFITFIYLWFATIMWQTLSCFSSDLGSLRLYKAFKGNKTVVCYLGSSWTHSLTHCHLNYENPG